MMRPAGTVLWLLITLLTSETLADFASGMAAFERGDYSTAVEEFLEDAEKEIPMAQFAVAWLYDWGLVVSPDEAATARWYRRAAVHGHAGAQLKLGLLYNAGEGVPEDYDEALYWARIAQMMWQFADTRRRFL